MLYMADFNKRRRWRGPPLGGRLQRAARFCFTAHDGEATTAQLTEWLRPELAGRRPLLWQRCNTLTAATERRVSHTAYEKTQKAHKTALFWMPNSVLAFCIIPAPKRTICTGQLSYNSL